MVVGCEDVKERGPMFPRLNIKNAEDKVGPKAPPRNKMVLYEQSKSNTPSQTISSELTPRFPPFLRKDLQVSSLSGLVSLLVLLIMIFGTKIFKISSIS